MSIHALKPWTELVKLHPDVESGSLAEAVFAIDLGAVAVGDGTTPTVYRDPDAFFAATYVTTDLRLILEEVLASLAGQGTYNRVLKLRSPFGGGKSHTLVSLLHAARSRKSLNQLPECRGLADPGQVDVAVFDGEKFTATGGKDVGGGQLVHTIWGWLAWQVGPKAYEVVRKHDADRVSPAGDEIKDMLQAEGRSVLLLLDEVLKYMERAAAVGVKDSTLQRQAKDFIQNLTVEVSNSTNAVMVYSLQWSAREALGNIALLEEIDHLTSRKDQVREPVTGDEVLCVVKRRLLAEEPSDDVALQVATEYGNVVAGYWRARAETQSSKQEAEEHALQLKSRMRSAYPFHPALIDVMNSRWTSTDFQRTRGAIPGVLPALAEDQGRGEVASGPGRYSRGRCRGRTGHDEGFGPSARVFAGPDARLDRSECPGQTNRRPASQGDASARERTARHSPGDGDPGLQLRRPETRSGNRAFAARSLGSRATGRMRQPGPG